MIYFTIVILFFTLVLIPYIFIILKVTKGERHSFWWLVRNGEKKLPFSMSAECGMGNGFIYCPHPFTNWSLNPSYKNQLGENSHTTDGFRKTNEADSIIQIVQNNPDAYKIVCVGGSTTYCTEVMRYQDTWPSRLNEKLSKENVLVFNFGVGGWGTLQSFIRCLTWFPIVCPQMVIIYQTKNDLTPLFNGSKMEGKIYPDYQNIMAQFSESLSFRFPKLLLYIPLLYLVEIKRLKKGLLNVYKPKPLAHAEGLKRVDEDIIKGILFRTEALINLCKMIDCDVIYIPEVVRGGEYATILDKIYQLIPDIICKYNNAILFDIKGLIPDSDQYFVDKMHLNEKGCELFAEVLARHIKRYYKNRLLNTRQQAGG